MLWTRLRPGRPASRAFSHSSRRNAEQAAPRRPSSPEASLLPGSSSSAHPELTTESTDRQSGSDHHHHEQLDLAALRERVREWTVLASTTLRHRADEFSTRATTTFSQLGLHLNRVTGYEEIEALKKKVVDQEARIKTARQAARDAKTAYDEAVIQRSVSQREVNDLLQRKSSWTDADVSNFTSLVRSDHTFEQEETRAKVRVAETEDAVDREFSELMRAILARYHEEQVWSDKIRSASTYGSLAALGVNLVVFIMAIIVVEPWKRRRLAQTFEKKVEEMGLETRALIDEGMAKVEHHLAQHGKLLVDTTSQVSAQHREKSFPPVVVEEPPSGSPSSAPSPSSTQAYFSRPVLGAVSTRELVLVAGSVVAGGAVTLLTRSLLGS
ncbi:Mdm33 family-domain-containing protein [Phlebopus sp. FC_14]|nr:Mdm33 family-domain-containing protein [Phlebopus sp. FC_14]